MAGSVGLYVAKTLQSKPEIPSPNAAATFLQGRFRLGRQLIRRDNDFTLSEAFIQKKPKSAALFRARNLLASALRSRNRLRLQPFSTRRELVRDIAGNQSCHLADPRSGGAPYLAWPPC